MSELLSVALFLASVATYAWKAGRNTWWFTATLLVLGFFILLNITLFASHYFTGDGINDAVLYTLTNTENVKNQVLDKLGLGTTEQKQDTNYLEGIQGMLNTKNGEQLNLSNIGNTPLAEKVKSKACDIVLKQGVNFLS